MTMQESFETLLAISKLFFGGGGKYILIKKLSCTSRLLGSPMGQKIPYIFRDLSLIFAVICRKMMNRLAVGNF